MRGYSNIVREMRHAFVVTAGKKRDTSRSNAPCHPEFVYLLHTIEAIIEVEESFMRPYTNDVP